MQEISSEDIIRRIRLENPWWEGKYPFDHFSPRAYISAFYPQLKKSVRRAVVLMGPRRIGKTVLIHHAIKKLVEEGNDPKRICYFSVDQPLYNGQSLDKLLDFYKEATGVDYRAEQIYVFFDEIQYLRQWEVHLKTMVDSLPNIKATASGSAAAALRLKTDESGAGRFTDFLLPPLTFYEYLDLLGKTSLLQASAITNRDRGNYFVATNLEDVNSEFVKYVNFGGYPEVMFSEQIQADPGRFIKSDIIEKVLLRDLPSLYGIGDIQELNYLFTTLAFNTAKELSLEELSKNSGVVKNTIKRYIEYLEAAFLIRVVHKIDRNARRFRRATSFKVYLTNPSMRAALFGPCGPDDEYMGALAETAIFSQWFHSDSDLHYARWPKGEVDIVYLSGNNQKPLWAVEVKWSDRYCDKTDGLKEIVGFCHSHKFENITVTSRSKEVSFKLGEVVVNFVPASVYCYTVGYNIVHRKRSVPAEAA